LTVTERSSTAAEVVDESRPPPSRVARTRRLRREYLLFLLFIAPNAVLLAVFAYWPIIYNGYLSLTSWDMLSPTKSFVGLENYRDMFSDPDFYGVLGRTFLFSAVVVVGCLVLGLAVALLLNQKLFGRNVVRTVSFAPHILSGVALGTVWLFIFDPKIGLMTVLLDKVGITGPAWMTDSKWALWGLVVVYLWKSIGFVAVVYLAGLQGMPADLYEAAKIDGAGAWRLFRRITLPLLSPVTFFVAVVTIVGTFQAFDIIAIMSDGGPGGATTTISWYIYNQAFRALDAGHAGAGGLVMFVILIAITAAQTIFMERKVHYR
jgi:sn-glycerol 3-phosphate transport system permease protein